MIKTSVIIGLVLSLIVCIGIPAVSFIYFARKKKKTLKPFLIGTLIFVVFQMLTRIPLINYVLPNMIWYIKLTTNPYMYGLFLGLTAGIFEEVGRYLAFKYMLKKNHRLIDGVAYGFGHGGIEAVIIAGIACINLLISVVAINNGTFESFMSAYPSSVSTTVYNQCMSLSTLSVLLIGFERICAMTIHIGFSLIVLYGIKINKIKYLLIAILGHGLVDAPLVILPAVFGIGTIGLEIYVFICAIVMLATAIYFGKKLLKLEEVKVG